MKKNYFPQTIWFIDDDPIVNQVNKRLCELCSFGSNVLTFTSQNNALTHFSECIQEDYNIPDLIFLDFMMPKMDGLDFLEKMEELHPMLYTKSRIIFLSSTESEDDIIRIKSKIQTKFLLKPLTKAHIDSIKLFFFFERI